VSFGRYFPNRVTSSAVAHRSGTISRKPTASTIERMASSLEPTFLYLSVKLNRDQSVTACGYPTHQRLDGLEATALTGSLLLPTTQSTDVTRLSRRFSGAVDLWGRATSGSRVRIGIARLRSPSVNSSYSSCCCRKRTSTRLGRRRKTCVPPPCPTPSCQRPCWC
jgi:hypothetical protein